MKITVEISEKDMRDVIQLTGVKKKGPAIRKLVADALMLRRRSEIARRFMTGEWSAELPPVSDLRKDRDSWDR